MLMTSAPMLVARTIPLARVASVEEALSLSSSFLGRMRRRFVGC